MGMFNQTRSAGSLIRTIGAVFVIGSLTLFGCSRFSGKYESPATLGGAMSVEFKGDNKAYITLMGTTIASDYSVDGDKITFKNVNGSDLVMTAEKDGSISGPMGLSLKKKD